MKRIRHYILFLLFLQACNTGSIEQAVATTAPEIQGDSIRFNLQEAGMLPRALVTEAYRNAIAEYIKAEFKDGKPLPDTLFIGKNVEFPDIKLPAAINNTNIRLLAMEEASEKFRNRKSMVYLNVMGWRQTDKSEFLIITFFEGGKPQHNCHLYFTHYSGNIFKLDSLNFEYPYPKK